MSKVIWGQEVRRLKVLTHYMFSFILLLNIFFSCVFF
jgi:hypothetical protein